MKCSRVIRLIVITGNPLSDDDSESVSREASPCSESPRPVSVGSESPNENICTMPNQINNINNTKSSGTNTNMSVVSKMGSHVMLGGSGRNLLLQKAVSTIFLTFNVTYFLWTSTSWRVVNLTNDNFRLATSNSDVNVIKSATHFMHAHVKWWISVEPVLRLSVMEWGVSWFWKKYSKLKRENLVMENWCPEKKILIFYGLW